MFIKIIQYYKKTPHYEYENFYNMKKYIEMVILVCYYVSV